MVVEITCPRCESALPMLAPPKGAKFDCPECGVEIRTSERLSVAPPAIGVEIRPGEGAIFAAVEADKEEPPSIGELAKKTARSLPPLPPRPRVEAPMPEARAPLYSLEPATMEMNVAHDLLQPPAFDAPVPRASVRWARYAGALSFAAALGILVTAGIRARSVAQERATQALEAAPRPAIVLPAVTTTPAAEAPAAATPPVVVAKVEDEAAPVAEEPLALPRPRTPERIERATVLPAAKVTPQAVVAPPSVTPAAVAPGVGPSEDDREEVEFDQKAAATALAEVNGRLSECSDPSVGPVTTRANVTFAPTGRVTTATVDALPSMMGTPVAGCIVSHLRAAKVEPFSGDKVTIHTTISFQ
jgi:hypothetical protein